MGNESTKIIPSGGVSSLPPPPPPDSGLVSKHVIADRYHLIREISRGGMGILQLARDTLLERYVAVKFMNLRRTPSEADNRRFMLEAMIPAQLGEDTEHVVRILDHGIDKGTRYIIMEYLTGEDLRARLERVGRLTVEELAPIVRQCASALRRAHARKLIHRDIKPDNIFLSRRDDEERVKIIDFGIVKALDPTKITATGQVLGTPAYMAPEQVRGLDVDARTDLWSLGVVLYQALTGNLPFYNESLFMLLTGICSDPIQPPSTIVPELSEEVDAFFVRALARSPEERFQSAEEFAQAFMLLAYGSIPPPSWWTPFSSIPPAAPISRIDVTETLPGTRI